MSADLLKRASVRLRENAGKASKPPWLSADDGLVWPNCLGDPVSGSQLLENAYYVEMMHPPVALALADAMEAVARALRFGAEFEARVGYGELIAVARAVLREPEGGDRTCTGLCDREPEGEHERGCPHQGGTG